MYIARDIGSSVQMLRRARRRITFRRITDFASMIRRSIVKMTLLIRSSWFTTNVRFSINLSSYCLHTPLTFARRLMRIGSELLPQQQFCLQLNASLCPVTETNSRFTVTVYNPLSHHQTAYVRFPVNDDDNAAFTLLDPDGD